MASKDDETTAAAVPAKPNTRRAAVAKPPEVELEETAPVVASMNLTEPQATDSERPQVIELPDGITITHY